MFPCMSPEGARGAIAWAVAIHIVGQFDAGILRGAVNKAVGIKSNAFADKPRYIRGTCQDAIDAVCARVHGV